MKLLLAVVLFVGLCRLGNSATTSKPRGVQGKCGGDFNGGQGILASPNFPRGKYGKNVTCDYTVTVPAGKVIKFEFAYLDMEDGPIQKLSHCYADYLVITEVSTEQGAMVGDQRFCGHDTPFNPVFTKSNRAYVWFRTDDTVEMNGFVLRWRAVSPPKDVFDCHFEAREGFCRGWKQLERYGRGKWKVNHGQTRSNKRFWITGPSFDHTKGTIAGAYAYVEATMMRRGSTVSLVSPPASMMRTERYCLSFWYHMYGNGIGALTVYEAQDYKQDPAIRGNALFKASGDHGKSWQEGQITLNRRSVPTRFIFEVRRGMNYRGDIAIDDITITENKCTGVK